MAPKRPAKAALDLDALQVPRDEVRSSGPTVKFRGKVFQLPPELPWEVVEGMSSASIDATGSTRALKAMFGTAAEGEGEDEEQSGYQRFLALKPSLTDIKNLFDHVLGLYDAELGESSAS